ncbi:MAG: TonB-dependent receptor [Bacteroidales bacterium]|jgi:TonB-linked SusC/RagA family outer membrane protein|nr:TonB-dependent receptor [Bacteroidales bacterium]
MKKFLLILTGAFIGTFSHLYAQKISVSGIVSDMEGAPIAGVNIIEKGTSNGAVTDTNGKYLIAVSTEESILVFSFIGFFEQEVIVGDKRQINTVLSEEAIEIEEVVVVGYGTQKKASVVGAISTVNVEDLQKTGVTNLTQALGGRISGVVTKVTGGRPGEDNAQIFIRGRASYNSGANAPLVLVDGVERDFSQIDPEDIESFSVLKDASATAVFGVRGANGVILITTRRGTTAKPSIDLRASFSTNTPTRLPKKLRSYDFARLKNEALNNVGQLSEYSTYDLDMYRTGESPYTHPDNDYFSDMLRNHAMKQQYNLVVRGGTPFVHYYVSANYLHEGGIYKTFDNDDYDTNVFFKRYGLRSNLDFHITRSTVLVVDLSGRLEERHNNGYGDGLYGSLVRTPPNYFNYVNPNGTLGGNLNLVNPRAALSHWGYDHSKRNVFETVIKLTQNLNMITPGLSVRGMFGYVSAMRSRRDVNQKPELWKYTKDGRYEIVQQEEFITIDVSADNQGPFQRNITMEAAMDYNRKFGHHSVTGLLAFNRLQTYYNANLPGGYVNYVGRITYGYKNKYLAEINAGYNGSMQFSKEKRFSLFPAFSAGWVISEENFWKNSIHAVNYVKLRGAYGQVGNDQIGSSKYLYEQLYPLLTSNRPTFGVTQQAVNRIYEGKEGSSEVGWERAEKYNAGIDIRLLKNKLSVSLDVFQEVRRDILDYDRSIPVLYGMLDAADGNKGFPPQNIGKVRNRGYEAEAGYNSRRGDFNYYARGNISFARNEILEIGETPVTYSWNSQKGKPINQRFGLIADGFYEDAADIADHPSGYSSNLKPGDLKYRDVNKDGITDSYDVYPVGKTQLPEYIFGLTLGGDWKGIDLQIFLQGAANSDIYVNGYGYWEFTNEGGVMEHHLGRWTPATKATATYPSLSPAKSDQNHRFSSFWLKKGDYLRLKNVQLGYSLPKKWINKINFSGMRIYISGTNILTFSEFKEYDPESNDGANTTYPPMKQYSLGVNLKF